MNHLKAKAGREVLTYAELFDAREATFEFSFHDLQRIAEKVRQATAGREPGPIAVVTTSNFIRGLARAYAALTIQDNPNFEVFGNLEDARNWIFQAASKTGQLRQEHVPS